MQIRNNTKLKSLKLSKIINNEIQPKYKNLKLNLPLYQSLTSNLQKNNRYKTKKNVTINSTDIQERTNYNIKNPNKFNKQSNILSLNDKNINSNLFKSLNSNNTNIANSISNSIGAKCFSVPQTLNYYGRNNIKRKAANVVIRMNKILLKNNINHLSLPKNPNSNILWKENNNNANNKKMINMKKNILRKKDFFIDENKSAKRKISLYELEKKRQKDKYNKILLDKSAELEACEKKFNIVIENTLMKLNNEEKNLYKL